MAKVFSENIVISIDIGTTKICVLVARKNNDGSIEILGVGKSPSYGLRKGTVIDINKTVESIKTALKEAELVSGHTIESAIIGVSGNHIKSFNSYGAVPIKKREVQKSDIAHVLETAKALAIPEGQQILHALPQYFSIDGHDKILHPIGMAGIRLEAQVHIITGSIASIQNIISCCQMAGVKVSDIILEQLASAQAVLSHDERELGVGVLDIGGGTSDFAIYQNGSIRHTMVLPVAGNHFTNDLAIGLQTTLGEAERIKKEFGISKHNIDTTDEIITVKKIHGSETKLAQQAQLIHVLKPRAKELLLLVRDEIDRYQLQSLMTTGLVLTGGGSLLYGITLVAEDVFGMPIRIGIPKTGQMLPDSLDSPIYATGYGLLLHAFNEKNQPSFDLSKNSTVSRLMFRMKSWVSDFF
jgi:cell division protein FtsA